MNGIIYHVIFLKVFFVMFSKTQHNSLEISSRKSIAYVNSLFLFIAA